MLSRLLPFPRRAPASASPALGIGLMVLSMLLFSISDVLTTFLTDRLHPIEIVWGRYAFNAVLVMGAVALGVFPSPRGASRPGLQLVRGAGMLGSSVFFVAALGAIPIATATAVGFVSPLFIMALSVPLLGERVGARRWAAAAVGFAGVLLVVRPGMEGVDPMALLPLLSSACWALAVVLTRKMGEAEAPERTYAWTVLSGLLGACALVPAVWVTPSAAEWGLLAVLGLLAGAGQYLLLRACVYMPASSLAPFSYSQMLWAIAAGWLVFATVPDAMTLVGAAVIVGSGIYIAGRERALHVRNPAVRAPECRPGDDAAPGVADRPVCGGTEAPCSPSGRGVAGASPLAAGDWRSDGVRSAAAPER